MVNDITRVMLLSDIHYGVKSGGDNTINYIQWMDMMDEYFNKFFLPLVENLKNDGEIPALIICGDFFDNRISIRLDVMNRAMDVVKKLASVMPVYMMVGNHDSYRSEDSLMNSLNIFRGIDNIEIIDTDRHLEMAGLAIDVFPWTSNYKELTKKVKGSTSDIVLLHADINGLKYPSNVVISDGVDCKTVKDIAIYAGHIHKRQRMGRITYIGSPYELDKSDIGNTKGVYVLAKHEGVVLEDWYENKVSPKFKNYTYDEFVKESVEHPENIKNNYVEITYEKSNKTDVAKIMNNSEEYGCTSIKFNYRDEAIETVELSEDKKNMTINETIEEYINSMNDITEEQRKFLIDKNKEYMQRLSDKQ